MGKRYAVIVTGDRNATYGEWAGIIGDALSGAHPDENELIVIHGGSTGIDSLAAKVIEEAWPLIPTLAFHDKHELYRAAAARGEYAAEIERNADMLSVLLDFRDAGYDVRVLAFHNYLDNSKGTANMVKQARIANVPVKVFRSRE